MSQESLLPPEAKEDLAVSLRGETDLGAYFNKIDINQFGGSSIINYFQKDKLVPSQITLSSRYHCILFEPLNGKHNFHILQRYTNAKLNEHVFDFVIKSFQLYDPMDCGIQNNLADGCAHLIMTVNKATEYGQQRFYIQKLNKNNSITTYQMNVTKGRNEFFCFKSVSVDFKYFALSIRWDEVQGPNGANVEHQFQFVKIVDGQLQLVSTTPKYNCYDASLDYFSKATFIGTTGKALLAMTSNALLLVDVESGNTLSQVQINIYKALELGYYMDTKRYFLMDRDKAMEWDITFEKDSLELIPTKAVMDYEPETQPEFSYSEVPYQYTLSNITSIYNKTNSSSFCVQQEAFELTMDDIRYSRSIVLPRLKVIYAIRKAAPHEVIILDLSNLDIKYVTTVSVPKLVFGVTSGDAFSQLILSNYCLFKSDVASGISLLGRLSQFVKENLKSFKLKNIQNVKDFDLAGKFLALKIDSLFHVYDLETKKLVSRPCAQNLTFSESGQAFVVNVSGQNFSYFAWNEEQQVFDMKVPLIKNVAARVDFLPGSDSKVIIFDEFYNALMLRDFGTGTVTTLFKNATFDANKYILISQDLFGYQENRYIDNKKTKVVVIYNLTTQVVEREIVSDDQIYDIKLSQDKHFIYVSSERCITIYDAHDMSLLIGSYSIQNVRNIIERPDRTYLICKHDESTYQIFGVTSINPIEKARQMTSGNFIMKFIIKGLQSDIQSTKDQALRAYMLFYQLGMVDSHLGPNGDTLLHYLIQNNRSNLLTTYFEEQRQSNPLYQLNFKQLSPIKLAYDNKKTQHMNMVLEYFLNCPNNFVANGEDLMILMQSPLLSAKQMVVQLFSQPTFHACTLPYTIPTEKQFLLEPVNSDLIGAKQCNDLVHKLQEQNSSTDQVFLTAVTKFEYNFERGSNSSIAFLQLYANSDSEEIVRSDLRLIVQHKFNECLPFLKIQCSLFFILLLVLLAKMVYFQTDIIVTGILFLLNLFFLGYEINQMVRSGLSEYFGSIWNYTDITGFVLLFVVNLGQFIPTLFQDDLAREGLTFIAVITIFCLLLRGMSHLRIFGNLRYLINMIVEIIKDMSSFTILLVYWIIGFNLMFFLFVMNGLKESGTEQVTSENSFKHFFTSLTLTYKLSFGDFSTDDFSILEWALFVLSSFFIPLVLFNLIIAIMGDTYDRVQTSARMVDLKEQANLVLEVEGLLHWNREKGEDEKKKLLIIYEQEQSEELAEGAAWEGKIKGLQKSMLKIEGKVNQVLDMKQDLIKAFQNELREQLKRR